MRGQIDTILKDISLYLFLHDSPQSEEAQELISSIVKENRIKFHRLEYLLNVVALESPDSTLQNRTSASWDIYEVLRHQLWQENPDRVSYTVDAYPARHTCNTLPLVQLEKDK